MSVRTAIIGMGVTGLSCLRYLAAREDGAPLVLDTRDAPPNADAARSLCPDAEYRFGAAACRASFEGVARVIVSPGVSLDHELVRRAAAAGAAVDSDIDVFCEAAPAPIYAVTGTNGKSTVTALAGHLLAGLGRNPGVGGNIGEPALDLLDEARDCYVLELSSFQLERLREQAFAAATILNVTEDHLDRHGSMAAYAASKQRIYRRTAVAVANRADPLTLPESEVPELVTFGLDAPAAGQWGLIDVDGATTLARGDEPLLGAAELPIAGLHNALNALAACALVSAGGAPLADLAGALRSFRGLPHRCLTVAERGGVRFVDDSKATNVGATLAALEGLGDAARRHLVLIAGGDGKGTEFGALAEPVGRYVKALVLLGQDAPRLELALADRAPVTRVTDMPQAVAAAAAVAQPGDVVLLSPACASLDMFRNYAHRGEAFVAAVEALA
ncbi:MAG: UDP-N-acetylmuramoyl-L-alanine--D-glutamate ligase [Gammaproteobacteria bacterium]|jgi:UDP-N-acetylmuramoylalanine--D-glutamate ligase|nr:UDP-N-acetylmuramoyl-L-alanine--D-glutamate ligase [Gammaproteobacteria bacterium]